MTSGSDRETLILNSNKLAMDYLREDNYKESLALLKKAEALLSVSEEGDKLDRTRLLCITLNNLGCYYKRRRQPNVALHYIQQALDLEVEAGRDLVSVAGTHLNLCAIYSQAGKHFEALHHANDALELIQTAMENSVPSNGSTALTTLVIAYHNVGVELEYQNRLSDAVEAYTKGHEAALQYLGPSHGLTDSISTSKSAAITRFRNLNSFTEVRKSSRDRTRVPSHDHITVLISSQSRRRAKSSAKVSESPPRKLPALRGREGQEARKSVIFPDFQPIESFAFLGSSTAEKPKFRATHRKTMEGAIAGTRKLTSPMEKLKAYHHS